MPHRARVLFWLVALASANCSGTFDPGRDPKPLRVLFVGNSLTYTGNVPEIVQRLATAGGQLMTYNALLQPNYSLEDHWNAGLAQEIERARPDIVVLQQGPSSQPDSRVNLSYWTLKIDSVVRGVGGRCALYMVWPPLSSSDLFFAVRDNYAAAAEAVRGMLMPAGVTWLEIWNRNPTIELYGQDGFHPAYLGALAAAETIYVMLFDVPAARIPRLDDDLPPGIRTLLKDAVAASVARWGRH
ncbi:MAG TPA: hypothetical protein VGP80_16305 [Gemmatimonadales bacterium]|nr:hypothetical protein [Gemmatimonadales bacterium]